MVMAERYFIYKKALLFDGEHHKEIRLNPAEAKSILKKSNALMLRNTYNFDNSTNPNFWYVIKDSFNGFDELKSRTRNKIRHAIKFFDIRTLTKEEVQNKTFNIYDKAYKSYKKTTDHILNKEEFISNIDYNNEFWGCIDKRNGKLVAYAENIVREESCEFRTLKADPDYLSNGFYPFYGLFYKMNEYYLKDKGLKYVSDGSRTITQNSNIQKFLITNFKFRKAYTDIYIYYKPMVKLAVTILYPFRKIIPQGKIKSVLRQESMTKNGHL